MDNCVGSEETQVVPVQFRVNNGTIIQLHVASIERSDNRLNPDSARRVE